MKNSLKKRVIIGILLAAAVLATAAVFVSYKAYATTMDEHYQTLTMNISKSAASMVDQDKAAQLTDAVMEIYREQCMDTGEAPDFDSFSETDWENYYAAYEAVTQMPEFADVFDVLAKLKKDNEVLWMYICYMDEETGKAVYIIDADDPENACYPGTCDDIEDNNLELMQNGIHDFPAYITNYDEYGWLCSASTAITDQNGKVIANAYVDISMDEVMRDRQSFLMRLMLILVLATIALIIAYSFAITKMIVEPVNLLARATEAFVSDKKKADPNRLSAISKLDIRSKDEIQELSESIKKMESEINTYIGDLTKITAEKERIGAELNVATKIQADMLPCIFPAFPGRTEFDIYATMTPAKEVGGDFYDFFLVDDDHLVMVMADVSGKGVPAALFMVIAKTLLKNSALNGLSPKEILEKVNNQLCENNEAEMFVTVWLGILEISTGKVVCANAGHEYPVIKHQSGPYELIKDKHGFVLAGMENSKYKEYEFELKSNDKFFIYTDGVPEATNAENKLFGTERMLESLNRSNAEKPKEALLALKADIDLFVGEAPQFDDITMLGLTYLKS